VQSCEESWSNVPQEQWVHKFINTLKMTPINWYLQAELSLITTDWEGMSQNFITTFLFESQFPSVDQELQIVRQKIFKEASSLPLEKDEDEWTVPLQKLQGCYNINVDENDDPRKVNIIEIEGQRDVEGPRVELPFIGQSIKINKVNIGIEKTPNFDNVRYYWDYCKKMIMQTPFKVVYGLEVVVPREYLVPSLRIVAFIYMDDLGVVQ
jgi:hypothetical protein